MTWHGLPYSITIQDNAGYTAQELFQWVTHFTSILGTFQGKDAFNWPQLISPVGLLFAGVQGKVYGGVGAALKGVRVVSADGVTPHPGFSSFQADDASGTYIPPNVLTIAAPNLLSGSNIHLFNVTTNALIETRLLVSSGYVYSTVSGVGISPGDVLQLRVAHVVTVVGKMPLTLNGICGSSGFTWGDAQVDNVVYNTWAVNGFAQTQYSADGVNIDIDITFGGSFTKVSIAAWWTAYMMTTDGISNFWGAFTLENVNSIRQEVAVIDVSLQNTTPGTVANFIDNNVRYYRSDFSNPFDTTPGYGSIFMDYDGTPFVVSTGGSALTTAEHNQLMTLDTSKLPAIAANTGLIPATL